MDRIEINGVWYVKEEYVKEDKLDLTEKDVTFSKSCVYETGDYCWEAVMLSKDNGENFYPDLEIEFVLHYFLPSWFYQIQSLLLGSTCVYVQLTLDPLADHLVRRPSIPRRS